jgi:hypothetical protein
MQKLMIVVITALALCGSAFWVVEAAPSAGRPSQDYSPIENIACNKGGDKCPYGFAVKKSGGHGWHCEPCRGAQGGGGYTGGYSGGYARDYDGPPPGYYPGYVPPPRYDPDYVPPPRYDPDYVPPPPPGYYPNYPPSGY